MQDDYKECDIVHSHLMHFANFIKMLEEGLRGRDIEELKKSIELLAKLLEEYLEDKESEDSKFHKLSKEMGLWIVKAYDIINGLSDGKIRASLSDVLCDKVIMTLNELIKEITIASYSNCLENNDISSTKEEGGYMYIFGDGSIVGYNNFINENKYMFTSDESKFYLFKNFREVNTMWRDLDLENSSQMSYKAHNPMIKKVFNCAWEEKKEVTVHIESQKVNFPLNITENNKTGSERNTEPDEYNFTATLVRQEVISGFRINIKFE